MAQSKSAAFAIACFFLTICFAFAEPVLLLDYKINTGECVVQRRNGEVWLIKKGQGATDLWNYVGKTIQIVSQGEFASPGSKIYLDEKNNLPFLSSATISSSKLIKEASKSQEEPPQRVVLVAPEPEPLPSRALDALNAEIQSLIKKHPASDRSKQLKISYLSEARDNVALALKIFAKSPPSEETLDTIAQIESKILSLIPQTRGNYPQALMELLRYSELYYQLAKTEQY